jgi:hypothetical protein
MARNECATQIRTRPRDTEPALQTKHNSKSLPLQPSSAATPAEQPPCAPQRNTCRTPPPPARSCRVHGLSTLCVRALLGNGHILGRERRVAQHHASQEALCTGQQARRAEGARQKTDSASAGGVQMRPCANGMQGSWRALDAPARVVACAAHQRALLGRQGSQGAPGRARWRPCPARGPSRPRPAGRSAACPRAGRSAGHTVAAPATAASAPAHTLATASVPDRCVAAG